MRFLKIFLLITTVIINVHISNNAFGYARRDDVVDYTTCATYTTRTGCNALNGCAWTSEYAAGNYCKRGDCKGAGTNCEERAGCYHPISTTCYACEAGNYCEYGTAKQVACSTGDYCPTGSAYPYPCPAGSYCPDPETLNNCTSGYYCPERTTALNTNNKCPSTHPVSPEKATAKSQCYYSIPAGYEYQAGSSVKCHSGGFCPGAQMKYGTTTDGWGWTSCSDSDIISGANGRTVNSSLGSDELTDCYVICPNVSITNGYKQQYYQYAEATSGGKGTFPACNYQTIKCDTGYEVNSSKNGCIAKTTIVSFNKNGGSGGDVSVTATYDADMPKITPPTRTGFTFNGYYYQSIKYYDTNGNSVRKWDQTTGNITLTASWTANTYNINYILNSGSFGAGTSHPTTANYDTEFTVSNPTRKNYTFASWSISGMSSGDTHYINGAGHTGTTATTATTKFKNLHYESGKTVNFNANWNGKYYEVTLNDTCPDGAAHPTTCKSGSQTVACSATPNKIYEKYDTGWYLTTQGGATFSQLTVLPVCNKYKFKGFCKGTCSDTNKEVINASGAKTGNMTNTMFSDDDTGTRQFTAAYDVCTCSASTGVQSCVAASTTAENKCVFTVTCKTGYSQDGASNGLITFPKTSDSNSYTATCQAITYGFKIDVNGGKDGTLPTGTIEIKYDAPLKNLSSYTVPCKAGYVITGLEDSDGNLYYEYNSSNKKLTAVSGKKWDKTENPTTLYVKYDACGGEGAGKNNTYCDCSSSKRNEKQNCPAPFQSAVGADEKTDCYMTGKINLSDKFGTTELDLDLSKLYIQ